ncbi:MAG: hypothetical protein OEY79_00010 [Anaplasmataceae bacterium]|nr:hypothetical protein [Anaplasmataceae bacterium]
MEIAKDHSSSDSTENVVRRELSLKEIEAIVYTTMCEFGDMRKDWIHIDPLSENIFNSLNQSSDKTTSQLLSETLKSGDKVIYTAESMFGYKEERSYKFFEKFYTPLISAIVSAELSPLEDKTDTVVAPSTVVDADINISTNDLLGILTKVLSDYCDDDDIYKIGCLIGNREAYGGTKQQTTTGFLEKWRAENKVTVTNYRASYEAVDFKGIKVADALLREIISKIEKKEQELNKDSVVSLANKNLTI